MDTHGTLFDLTGKVAVVTGGTGAIGAAIARAFAAHGADVLVAGQAVRAERMPAERAKARTVCESIASFGRRAVDYYLDITDRSSTQEMARVAIEEFRGIDILANCAGRVIRNTILEIEDADWDAVHDVNLKGVLYCCQAAIPSMIDRGGGKIVNIASISSVLGHPARAAYAASKGALVQLSRVMATELAPNQICVNAISPAVVDTPFIGGLKSNRTLFARELERIPMGRIAVPEDLVGTALLFASGASDFITGQNLIIDGGRSVD